MRVLFLIPVDYVGTNPKSPNKGWTQNEKVLEQNCMDYVTMSVASQAVHGRLASQIQIF